MKKFTNLRISQNRKAPNNDNIVQLKEKKPTHQMLKKNIYPHNAE